MARRPWRHDALDRLDVDERLAAAGHAVQQRRIEAAPVERRIDPLQRALLLLRRRHDLLGRGARCRLRRRPFVTLAQRARTDRARDHGVAETGEQRVGASDLAVHAHERDQRLGLLSRDRAVAERERADAILERARLDELTLPQQRAGPYERAHVRQQRAPIAGAPRFRMAQQLFEREAVRNSSQISRISRSRYRRKAPWVRPCAEHERVAHARYGVRQHDRAQRFAQRAEIVLGDELGEVQAGFVERPRDVEPFAHRLERVRRLDRFADRRDDERDCVAAPQRNAHDVADRQVQRAGVVGQRQIEARRADRRQRVNDAHQRPPLVPGGFCSLCTAARTLAGAHATPYSTSPMARGRTKRRRPARVFLSWRIAASTARRQATCAAAAGATPRASARAGVPPR